jgi:RNA polymerase sigma factor (sigma-70 family)
MASMDADTGRAELSAALARVAQGERAALEDVYRRTSAKLFGICLRVLGDRAEAEDVLQEVYLIVWRRAGQFDAGRASPITWLATLARNRAIDQARRRGTRAFAPEEAAIAEPDPSPSAEAQLALAGDTRQLQDCLEALEPAGATAIRTAFFEGLTYEALARKLGAPLGTIKTRIRRSLAQLRLCLQ